MTSKDRLPIPVSFPEGIHFEGLEKNLKGEILGLSREELETKLRELSKGSTEGAPTALGRLAQAVIDFLEVGIQERLEELKREAAQGFIKIPSHEIIDNLARTITKELAEGDVALSIGGLEVSIQDHERQSMILGTYAHKVHTLGLATLLAQNESKPGQGALKLNIALPLDQIMTVTDAKDTPRNRREVRAKTLDALNRLENVRLEWRAKDKAGRGEGDYIRWAMIEGQGILGDAFYITYGNIFAQAMLNRFVSRLHRNSWLIDGRIQAAWPLNIKLHTYYFNDRNQERGSYDRLSVKVILDWLSLIIPSEEQVRETDRHYKKRIVAPLENALNEIARVGVITWDYCNAKRSSLTAAQKRAVRDGDYSTIKDLYITFTITGADEEYEQDAPRLERKQEAMEKQAKMEEKAAQKALDKQAQIALSDSMLTAD